MYYNLKNIRLDFPAINNLIYLDNASTSQKPICLINEVTDYLKQSANYGRGTYKLALKITEKCDDVRIQIGNFFNVNFKHIIFTKSTTDSINIVINGFNFKKNDHIIISSIEHNSNFVPWSLLQLNGINISILNADSNGFILLQDIVNLINKNTKLIAITHISNFYGSKQKIEEIVKLSHDFKINVLVDGAQSSGHIPIDLKSLNCDIFVTSGHKGLLGPQGIGLLYLKDPHIIKPSCFGGGNIREMDYPNIYLKEYPYSFEAGTPNIPGILGLGSSISYIKKIGIKTIEKYERYITNYCFRKLNEIAEIEIYGNSKKINIISFNVNNIDANTISFYLDTYNICVRSGYHCSNYIHNKLKIDGSIRVSIALYNTKEEIDIFIEALNEILYFI